ncbi:MAG: ABC transporter ATP-binding protein [Pseudomonadota bacterium]
MNLIEPNSSASDKLAGRKTPLLEVANLEVVYKESILAVEGVSIVVPRGSIVAVIGSNGAGKTTMLRAITGILQSVEGKITKGRILVNGEVLSGHEPSQVVEAGIRLVPEGRRVFVDLTVEDNLLVGAHTLRDRRIARERVEEMLELFPRLAVRRKSLAGYLSGGEQQMLAIGRALISNPSLLMLDEPSLGLAPMMVDEIFNTIAQIHRERGMTVLLVEQSATRSLELASYCYILQNGRVVLENDSSVLTQHEDVREFYLGVGKEGARRSFMEIKSYRRRKRWLG